MSSILIPNTGISFPPHDEKKKKENKSKNQRWKQKELSDDSHKQSIFI